MLRGVRLTFGVLALLGAAGAGEARAQFGYGYYPRGYGGYGWGGWGGAGSTVGGSMAQGLGYYAQGLGQYNEQTAIANSINTDTVMRWNEYMWESQTIANHNERLRMARRLARDAATSDVIEKRLRDNPSDDDIGNGDALNAALDQINHPSVHSSSLRLAKDKIPARLIRAIPFNNASEAVTISLDRLTGEKDWPAALRDPRFDADRAAYSQAVDRALEEDKNGEIAPATIQEARAALRRIRATLEASPPTDRARFGEAETYLKTLYGMTRMLERPDVEKVIAELEKIKETSLGSLLGFMHTFNLRFGRATTPTQRAAYEELFPMLDNLRDKIAAETGSSPKARRAAGTAPGRPTDFFRGLHLDHLEGRRQGNPDTDTAKPPG
jgi:hypothetical protein